ncbi:(2Fe-2S)-binding protein, partial [Verminephrobacter eiseniae]|uniref:(2Fe-2S)-binding protein n=1 Tax=Verminephrobacter eiseniae TaxID=364317 RepID=UPI002242F848
MSARLTHCSIATGGRPIRFWYDGQAVDGLEGETVAAALAASHIRQMRHTREGERRGLYCGMGACFDCLVTVDGVASQRACLTKVADGQQIRSTIPAGTSADPLQPLTPPADAEPTEQDVDVLVVGAGPAGLSPALAARQAGASVLV